MLCNKVSFSELLLNNDCSIRVYQSFVAIFQKIFSIILALCLILSVTYYAQNYAGITYFRIMHGNWSIMQD